MDEINMDDICGYPYFRKPPKDVVLMLILDFPHVFVILDIRSLDGVSINGGYPHSWMVYNGKSQSKMDDDWAYPYFRKPPYGSTKRGFSIFWV